MNLGSTESPTSTFRKSMTGPSSPLQKRKSTQQAVNKESGASETTSLRNKSRSSSPAKRQFSTVDGFTQALNDKLQEAAKKQ